MGPGKSSAGGKSLETLTVGEKRRRISKAGRKRAAQGPLEGSGVMGHGRYRIPGQRGTF